MKTFNTVLTCCFLVLASSLFAQENIKILCGHDIAMKAMEQNHPGYRDAVDQTFENAQRLGANPNSRQSVYTIPLVIHVVWKDSIENLADSIIQAQVDVLNADFRRMNADAVNIRPEFDSVVGDPMIQFDLVDVIRVETTVDFEPSLTELPDNVKETANGGSDAWDTEGYLNIWVCELQPITIFGIPLGQILGYAYPPAEHPNWPTGNDAPSPELEGVVIDFRVFGPNNPNEIDAGTGPLTIAGRTPVHEVGHYLGLRHIWGDGGGITGGDSCADDDMIDDTPNAGSQSNFDCDFTRNTCIDQDTINDLPDMIENYMDYSAETCMNSFTQGQIDIMRAVLETTRCGLINACAVSTEEQPILNGDLSVFPNPTSGQLSIQLNNPKLTEFAIEIKDIMGKSLLSVDQANRAEAAYNLDLSGFAAGVYLVEVRTNAGVFAKKVLLSK